MNVRLTPEQEKIVTEEIRRGRFRTAEEVISSALEQLRQAERSEGTLTSAAQISAVSEMQAFVEQHHVRLEGISVKDLIHEGHTL